MYSLWRTTGSPRAAGASLRCSPGGEGALLSHLSNAINLGISASARARYDVTVPRNRRSSDAIEFHRSRTLAPQDRTTHDGIPCTSAARTLLDVAEQTGRSRTVERALNQAFIEQLLAPDEIEDVLARANGRCGGPLLNAAFELYRQEGPMPTRNELEHAMVEICRRESLPRPECNVEVLGRERDFHWLEHRLVAEVDGFSTHNTPWAFRDDRWRDVDLTVAGYSVLRFPWQDVMRAPGRVGGALGAWFAGAGAGRRRTIAA